jgi:hypothetical protein
VVSVSDKESSFFDGINTSLMGIADLAEGGDNAFLKQGLSQINGLVEKAIGDFSAQHPESIASTLVAGLKATDSLLQQVGSSGLSADSKYNVIHLEIEEEQPKKKQGFFERMKQAVTLSLI